MNKGTCLAKMQKYTEAKQSLDDAIKMDNEYGKAYLRRGEVNFELKDFIQSKLDWEKVRSIN